MESRAQLSESYCRKSVDESLPELQSRWPTKESLLRIIEKGGRNSEMQFTNKGKKMKSSPVRHRDEECGKKAGMGFSEGALKC